MSTFVNSFRKVKSLFEPPPHVAISFTDVEEQPRGQRYAGDVENHIDPSSMNRADQWMPVYTKGQSISGTIDIVLVQGTQEYEFDEISVYLIGALACPQLDKDIVFMSQKLCIAPGPSKLNQSMQYDFGFSRPNFDRESFYGSVVTTRYFIQAVIKRPGVLSNTVRKEQDFLVRLKSTHKPAKMPTSLQVGVDEALHIKFDYDNINVALPNGHLTGKVYFVLNTLKIVQMTMQLLRREVVLTGNPSSPELVNTQTIGKCEIMDGTPIPEDEIPIRVPFGRFQNLSPTIELKQYSVRYYLNLVLVDADGRRYFKSTEVSLYRKKVK